MGQGYGVGVVMGRERGVGKVLGCLWGGNGDGKGYGTSMGLGWGGFGTPIWGRAADGGSDGASPPQEKIKEIGERQPDKCVPPKPPPPPWGHPRRYGAAP